VVYNILIVEVLRQEKSYAANKNITARFKIFAAIGLNVKINAHLL
jgi:hypothetical protein